MERSIKTISSFNAGEVSPLVRYRVDLAKYNSACISLNNSIASKYGPASRRPGTRFVAAAKTGVASFMLDTTGIDTLFSAFVAASVGATTFYSDETNRSFFSNIGATLFGIALWKSTGGTARTLVNFWQAGVDFTIGDTIDFTSLVSSGTIFFSIIYQTQNGSYDVELPVNSSITSQSGGITTQDYATMDAVAPYIFTADCLKSDDSIVSIKNTFGGVNIPNFSTDALLMSLSQKLTLPPA